MLLLVVRHNDARSSFIQIRRILYMCGPVFSNVTYANNYLQNNRIASEWIKWVISKEFWNLSWKLATRMKRNHNCKLNEAQRHVTDTFSVDLSLASITQVTEIVCFYNEMLYCEYCKRFDNKICMEFRSHGNVLMHFTCKLYRAT